MKKKLLAMLVCVSTCIMGLTGCGQEIMDVLENVKNDNAQSINSDSFSDDYPILTEENMDVKLGLEDVKQLTLEVGGITVLMESGDVSECEITGENIDKMQAYTEAGRMYIIAINSDVMNTKDSTLHIVFPKDFAFEKMEMEMGAGELKMLDYNCQTLKCEMGAGKLTMDNAYVSGDAKIECGAGEVNFQGVIEGNLEAVCAAGNLEMKLSNTDMDDHNYKMECAAGNLEVGEEKVSGLASTKEIDNGMPTTYDLECAAGNLKIEFE